MSDPKIVKRIVRALSDPMSPAQLAAIGKITVVWNSVEHTLQTLIWVGARIDEQIGEFITLEMSNPARIQAMRNIANYYSTKKPFVQKYISAAIDLFDQSRIVRNSVIHGLPVIQSDPKAGVSQIEKRTARKGSGQISASRHDISIGSLEDFLDCLQDTILALQSASFMLFHIQLENMGAAEAGPFDDEYISAQRISLNNILSRTDKLRQR